MKRKTFTLIVAVLLVTSATLYAQQLPGPLNREQQWQQDLAYFAAEFPHRHKDFTRLYPQPAFDDEVAKIKTDLTRLTDAEVTLRIMKLVAGANIDHTYVYLPALKLGFDQFPLKFSWFADGLAVTETSADNLEALGARVIRIGPKTPEQLLSELAPYIGHENQAWLRLMSRPFLAKPPVLERLGALDPDGRITLTLTKKDGEAFRVTVSPSLVIENRMVSMYNALKVPPMLYRKKLNSFYWYEYLPGSQAIYLQYNRCANDPALSLASFASGLLALTDSHTVKRVIIDLRFNGGGDSTVIEPLLKGLKDRASLRSNLRVLIGPATFSSAQFAAFALRRELHALLIGEPTGEKLNGYGEVRLLVLPNSQLTIQYSTKFFRLVKDSDATALEPDIRVSATLAEVLAGRDPVLEAALR